MEEFLLRNLHMGQFLWSVEYLPVMELPQITANL